MHQFSEFLAAKKKRDQSEKYLLLSAMYCVGADRESVTAGQVIDYLKRHIGSRAPKNIYNLLRRYEILFSPEKSTRPLRWRLTDLGLAELRRLSGLALSRKSGREEFAIDVGIVCALEYPELEAVVKSLGGPDRFKEVGSTRLAHVYREANLTTTKGSDLKIVITTSTSMGLTAAAIATTHLINNFRPKLIAMIGIAAGTRNGGKQFGDVLIADPSVDYNSGKVIMQDGVRGFQPDPYPIGLHTRLRSVLRKFCNDPSIFQEIRGRWMGKSPDQPNRAHIGPVGAADQVIDDASLILDIQKNWRKLIGVEMETYGVYRAVNEAPEPKPRVVSFKAVCDFAAEKTDSWQNYAAYFAAEFTIEFIKKEWENLWPES